ncbi:DDE-type integrase/transposase/recombinase, partial [Paludifilum halophilum]
MIFIDDFTRMMWVAFLKEKSEAFEKFKMFKNRVENKSSVKIKCLRYNRGGEFSSREFNIFCEENGIKWHLSSPRTPEHNGIAEIRSKLVVEVARAMFLENDISKTFWREAINITMCTLN